jgi:hypothetical protein
MTEQRGLRPLPNWIYAQLCLAVVLCGGCHAAKPAPPSHVAQAAPAASRRVRFEDVTHQAGIDFVHIRASSGKKYFIETMGAGGGVIDYDNDGDLDLLFVQGAPLPGFKATQKLTPKFYRNDGKGKFTDVTQAAGFDAQFYGMGCCVGDYDNDGWDDVYLTAVLGASHLYRNNGNGTFRDVTQAAGASNESDWGTSGAWLDYDKDGDLDLIVVNYVQYRSIDDDVPCSYREGTRSYCIPSAYKGSSIRLYRNQLKERGKATFADVTQAAKVYNPEGKGLGVAVWDYDQDGWMDFIIANDTQPNFLYHNNKDGTFSDVAAEVGVAYSVSGQAKAGMGIDMADDLNNAKTAVVVTNFSGEMLGFYRQTSADSFEEQSVESGLGNVSRRALGFGVFFFDADNDGWKDVFVVNGHVQDDAEVLHSNTTYAQKPFLFRNLGNGKYQEVGIPSGAPFTQAIVGRGAAWGDVDNDGRLDVIVTENNGRARLWRNATQTDHHWLVVKLVGVQSNRNGIGAQIRLTTPDTTQINYVRSGSSYLTSNDLRAHFGLGEATQADVEIRWPSGVIDRLNEVKADQILTVKEGSGNGKDR